MTPERWQAVGDLFTAALAVPEALRAAWLAASGAPDDVRQDVAALLVAHASSEAETFLEAPAVPVPSSVPTPAPPDPALVPGAVFGPYRLVREVGRGGMGVVFEAEDTRLQRRVALKAVPSAPAESGRREVERLRHEARAAAALAHPAIATVYALEEIDGRTFIARELVEGETLREVLGRGPLDRAALLDVACALATALEAAHARGIVHRDLKPENVLCQPDGGVKVLDFGLARLAGEARLPGAVSLTLPGMVAGTPGYMAPEQLLGEAVDGRADQFALGVLIVEMATGRHPFEARTLPETIARLLASDGLPTGLAGAPLDADLAALAGRCLRRRPEDRYPDSTAVVQAIAVCRHGPPDARPVHVLSPGAAPVVASGMRDPATGRRPAMWWWRFHQAASAAVNWLMVVPAWLVHRDLDHGLAWFLGCLAATIVAANVRLHLRFSAAVLPAELPAQRARTRGWVAIADWALIVLWAWAGVSLAGTAREWAVVFVAFAIGAAVAVALIEPATTRAAFGPPHDEPRL